MHPSDNDLIEAYSDGDTDAIETLISRYLPLVYSYAFRMTKSENDASDITQDVFIKVWKKIGRFDRSKEFKPWLLTIVHNTVIDWTRKRKPLIFSQMTETDDMPFDESLADDAPLPDDLFANNEWKKLLDDALATLPLTQKEIIILHHSEDMTFEMIATMLKKSINTIKSSYRRGISKLRGMLVNSQGAL